MFVDVNRSMQYLNEQEELYMFGQKKNEDNAMAEEN